MSLDTNIHHSLETQDLPENLRSWLWVLARDTWVAESRLKRNILLAQVGSSNLDFDEIFWSTGNNVENSLVETTPEDEVSIEINFDEIFWSRSDSKETPWDWLWDTHETGEERASPESWEAQHLDSRYRDFLDQLSINENQLWTILERVDTESREFAWIIESLIDSWEIEWRFDSISLSTIATHRIWNRDFNWQLTSLLNQSSWPYKVQVPSGVDWNNLVLTESDFRTKAEALQELFEIRLLLQFIGSDEIQSRIAELNRGQRSLEVESTGNDSDTPYWLLWTIAWATALFLLIGYKVKKWKRNRQTAAWSVTPTTPSSPTPAAPAESSEALSERWQRVQQLIEILESDNKNLQKVQDDVKNFSRTWYDSLSEEDFYRRLRAFINDTRPWWFSGAIIKPRGIRKLRPAIHAFIDEQHTTRTNIIASFSDWWDSDRQIRNYIQLSHEYANADEHVKIREYVKRSWEIIETWRLWQLIFWQNPVDAERAIQQDFLSAINSGKTPAEVFWRSWLWARLWEIDILRMFTEEQLRSIPGEIATPDHIRARQLYLELRNPGTTIDIEVNLREFLGSIWRNTGTNRQHWYNFKTAYAIIQRILEWQDVATAKNNWFALDWSMLDSRIWDNSFDTYLLRNNRAFIGWELRTSIINHINSFTSERELLDFERRMGAKLYERVWSSSWYEYLARDAFDDIILDIERAFEESKTRLGIWTPVPDRTSEAIGNTDETRRAAEAERPASNINNWLITNSERLTVYAQNRFDIVRNFLILEWIDLNSVDLWEVRARILQNDIVNLWDLDIEMRRVLQAAWIDDTPIRNFWPNTLGSMKRRIIQISANDTFDRILLGLHIEWRQSILSSLRTNRSQRVRELQDMIASDPNRPISSYPFKGIDINIPDWSYIESRTRLLDWDIRSIIWNSDRVFISQDIPTRISFYESLWAALRRIRR